MENHRVAWSCQSLGRNKMSRKKSMKKADIVNSYIALMLSAVKATTDRIALFCVWRIRVCGKSELQSVGGSGNSVAGCPFIFRVLHFKVRGASQNSGCYRHPHQCNMNTKPGHSALTVFYKICVNNNKICLWRTENIYEISRKKHGGARSVWTLIP